MKIYLARAMTGRLKCDVLREAELANSLVRAHGIEPLDPVTQEGVENVPEILAAPDEHLRKFWRRDKEMIREAHVVFDMSPEMKSEGVAHEVAYARYYLWKPVVRVYSAEEQIPLVSVARIEDDYLAPNLDLALVYAKNRFGTRGRRFKWRAKMLVRCFWKFCLYQALEWK
jgi:hypothetical protein